MRRRTLLQLAAGIAARGAMPIIDTHIHLFDPTRPQGVPWPAKNNAVLYQPALPPRYRRVTGPFGITGAIAVEASPWFEDNQWLLDVARGDPMIVGVVGNLEPGKPDFRRHLERFGGDPLFRGIRYGNLWGRNLGAGLANPQFIADCKALAAAGLSLDTANPTHALMADVLRLSDRVPDLPIILDHLPRLPQPYPDALRELAKRPRVYAKISAVLRREQEDFAFYRPILDALCDLFGPDRVLYGSDWPNSDQSAPYPKVFAIVSDYFAAKGQGAAENYFWKNSQAAYRWRRRSPAA